MLETYHRCHPTTRAVDATGTKTKVCNCHQNNNFGPVAGKCYNHATQVPFYCGNCGNSPRLRVWPPRAEIVYEDLLMTRLIRPAAVLLLVMAVSLPLAADKAKSLYAKGKDAEARQNYESAYDFYKQAYDLKPKDLRYRTSFERMRFLAAASHVHRGQLLREAGKLDEALAEFQKATAIDPSSFIAQQEIRRTQQMIQEATNPQPQAATSPPNSLKRRLEQALGPVDLAPISNIPITLKAT